MCNFIKNFGNFFRWKNTGTVISYLVITAISAAMFLPFVWMVCTAFKSSAEVSGTHFWPHFPRPENFAIVLRRMAEPFSGVKLDLHLLRWILNSMFVASWVTFLQVFTSCMAAYAFSRLHWKGRDKVFMLYLATMMVPSLVLVIPRFQIMVNLKLVNSYVGLILPDAFSAFGTFLLRQFMLGIPKSYDEAAEMDGASHWQIFNRIIIPLAGPGIITLAIFTFLGKYRGLLWPLIMIKDDRLVNVPVGMLSFQGTYGSQTELLMAGTMVCIIPLILLFVVLQRKLVKGVYLGGGVKE